MPWVYYCLLIPLLFIGLLINLFTLPGLWVMLAADAIYIWRTGGLFLTWRHWLILLGITLLAELIEFFAAGAGAKKAGASRLGMLGALVGGILGGIFLTFIPIPIVSTVVGILLGSFLGAAAVEMLQRGDISHSMRVGVGAAKGRLFGILSKSMFACIVLILSLYLGFPRRTILPIPATAPASTTSTAVTTAPR
ncbi:MAG TPA: DUF456 domain-containing protein [Tepidisphaeraceae bacterium]